ncbi:MAG: DUF1269 domain-containing protein [Anaerolineae bacterium]
MLSVLRCDVDDDAQRLESTLIKLRSAQLITIFDAALVEWPPGKTHPQVHQLIRLARQGTSQSAICSKLLDAIFDERSDEIAGVTQAGAHAGRAAEYGIDDQFIHQIRERVTEGSWALFLLTTGPVIDKLADAAQDMDFEIISVIVDQNKGHEIWATVGVE